MIKEHEYIQFLSYIPKILLAIIIPIFDDLYHKVAVWLNDMGELNIVSDKCNKYHIHQRLEQLISNFSENYRSDESFEEHFVLKLILVSTVAILPSNFHFSFLHPTEVVLSIFKGNPKFKVTKSITLHSGFTIYIHTVLILLFLKSPALVLYKFLLCCFNILY